MNNEPTVMTDNEIKKSVDFVLLNAYATPSSGLYNGKAGLALSLFEWARAYDNNAWEEHAFELLQETLLTRNKAVDFENGLSGIGYAFSYLIENRFIEADFNDLFGEKSEFIVTELAKTDDERCYRYFSSVPFLIELYRMNPDKKTKALLHRFYRLRLTGLLRRFRNPETVSKPELLDRFTELLHAVSLSAEYEINGLYDRSALKETIDAYTNRYLGQTLTSRIGIGYYLERLERCKAIAPSERNREVAERNMRFAIRDLHPEIMYLKEKLTAAYRLRNTYPETAERLWRSVIRVPRKSTERSIASHFRPQAVRYGYDQGVSKLLNYAVWKKYSDRGQETARFDKIFY